MRNAIVVTAAVMTTWGMPAISRGQGQATAAKTDQAFVTDAARANMAEVAIGNIAETKATDTQVKDFARRMVADHGKALESLKVVAKNEHVTLPTSLDPKDEALKDRLEKLSGAAFDRAYMSAMVKDHRQDVAEFRTESRNAKTPEVKQYAASTLPTLEEHLKMAQSTDKSIIATTRHTTK